MKTNILSKLMLATLTVAAGLALAACSNDDNEPNNTNRDLDDAIARLYDGDGTPSVVGFEKENGTIYVAPASTSESAKTILEYYLGTEASATAFTREFDANNSIKVTPGAEEGLFYNVSVNFATREPFTFVIAHPQWVSDDNLVTSRPTWHGDLSIDCIDCGYHWTMVIQQWTNAHKCKSCGSTNVIVRKSGH